MQRPSHSDKNVPTKRSSHVPRSTRSAGADAVLRALRVARNTQNQSKNNTPKVVHCKSIGDTLTNAAVQRDPAGHPVPGLCPVMSAVRHGKVLHRGDQPPLISESVVEVLYGRRP